jgi:(R,R)-butanediol dehydrogenase/meso-butanediol dehydrogenase/diacetyl reductase
MARLVNVPGYMLVPLSERVSDAQGAMTEPLAVALHALERGGARAGMSVLVLGFGSIGAAGALLAQSVGCAPVVVDASPQRAERAAELGFDVLEAGGELPRRLRRTLGRLGADIVLECTGVPGLLPDAIRCAERGGRIVLVGLGKNPAEVEPSSLALYERSLIGSLAYHHDLPRVVAMMDAGLLDPTPLIGEVIELADAPTALQQLATTPDRRLKVLVRPARP